MDLTGLVLLVDILDAGNLSSAAHKLKVSRVNVSYHLQQLEKSVGMQLVRRTTQRIEPTEIGQTLYRHGLTIRDELAAAREAIDTLGRGLHGAVRVSVPTGFGHLVMTGWLLEFKCQYPDISLELLFENRVDNLLRDEVDVAIRLIFEPPEALVARELAQVRHVASASTGFVQTVGRPVDLEDLRGMPLITSPVVGRELRLAAYRDDVRHEVTLNPTLASESFQFLRSAILSGLGVGPVPSYVVPDGVNAGQVVTALNA